MSLLHNEQTNLSYPLVSIITVSYNAAKTIEKTILSVINQSYPNIEYIIIDGNSTDGTVEIIKKYQKYIKLWVSEPDGGIYDAMNKGIFRATGEWINFMNSGDRFYNKEVINSLFSEHISSSYSVIYGNTVFEYNETSEVEYQQPKEKGNFRYMPACHQAIFCRTKFMKQYLFNTKYKIAADLDFFYQLSQINSNYLYKNITIAFFDAMGGISSQNKYQRNKEFIEIKEKKYIRKKWLLIRLKIKYLFKYIHSKRK